MRLYGSSIEPTVKTALRPLHSQYTPVELASQQLKISSGRGCGRLRKIHEVSLNPPRASRIPALATGLDSAPIGSRAMSSGSQKPILIAGGGLASLLLAQSLLIHKIPFQVFERDSSPVFRGQGYRLRLSELGLNAVEATLSPEQWKVFWDTAGKTTGAGFVALDGITGERIETGPPNIDPKPKSQDDKQDGETKKETTASLAGRGNQVVGMARGDMRKIFMHGCEDYIQWNKQVASYETTESGVIVHFADGSKSVEGSMLIGGEGIYSKVARQLSNGKIKIFDTGARGKISGKLHTQTLTRLGIHGQAPTTAFKGLGEGVWRIADDSRPDGRVFAITNVRSGDMDDPNMMFGWTMGAQPGIIEPPGGDYTIVGKVAADIAKSLAAKWHPTKLRPLFDEMDVENAAFWKITCSSPSGVPEWTNDPRVTVIGDAVHGRLRASATHR